VRTILWGHGYSKSENAVRRKVRDSVASLATALMFYNQTAANSYIEDGWNPASIFVARNSLDQEPINRAKQEWLSSPGKLNEFRTEQNFGPGPHILFVSRLETANRLDVLVEAIVQLRSDFPHIQVNVVGKGAAEQARIEALAISRGVSSHFRFVGPIYDELAVAPWFLASDVFCYPANIGLSILHAFGYGLSVVTSDDLGGQNPEIEALKPGQNGLLYRHGDPAALAGSLRTIFLDKELANQMSQEAVRTVEGEFSLSGMVNEMAKAVRYCANKS
jgi:glycosyltransferase involved in cell wall biosynthesis